MTSNPPALMAAKASPPPREMQSAKWPAAIQDKHTVSLVSSAKHSWITAGNLADCISRGGEEALAAIKAGELDALLERLKESTATE